MWLIKDMWNDGFVGRSFLLFVAAMLAMVPLLIYAIQQDAQRWAEFKAAHDCKVVGHVRGDVQTGVGFGVTGNGSFGPVVVTSSTPSKTGWLCDDGVTYWR